MEEFAVLVTMQGKVTGNTVLIYTGLYNYFMASQQWGDFVNHDQTTQRKTNSLFNTKQDKMQDFL